MCLKSADGNGGVVLRGQNVVVAMQDTTCTSVTKYGNLRVPISDQHSWSNGEIIKKPILDEFDPVLEEVEPSVNSELEPKNEVA